MSNEVNNNNHSYEAGNLSFAHPDIEFLGRVKGWLKHLGIVEEMGFKDILAC